MKSLQLGLGWFPESAGGLERVYYDFLRFAPEVGLDIRGLVLGSDQVAVATDGRVQAFASSSDSVPIRLWRSRQAVERTIRDFNPDIVTSHFALLACPALSRIDRPYVVHFHGPWAQEGALEGSGRLPTLFKSTVESIVYRRADRLIVLSSAFADILERDFHIPRDRIGIVPGGVDFKRFASTRSRTEARIQLGWPTDRPVILVVRRLVARMGLPMLIEAMDAVVRQCPDVLLMIAGRGPLAESLQALIDEKNLGNHIKLAGFVPDADLPTAYRAANFSLIPTVGLEGFGLIALESLASGTPVLVTPVGGLPEVVKGLSAALIFERADAAAISGKLIDVLKSGGLPDQAACSAYAEAFDWVQIAGRIKAEYQLCL